MTRQFLIGYLGQFGFLAWVLLIGGIGLAVWKLKRWATRALAIAVILGLFAAFPGRWAWEVQKQSDQYRAYYNASAAMYQERCQTQAGYKIYKVVEDVEGIQLLKIRHPVKNDDPMAPGAAFALESTDDGYITSFLGYRSPVLGSTDGSYFASTTKNADAIPGFRYVDLVDDKDGQRYRISGHWEELWLKDKSYLKGHLFFSLDRTPTTDPAARYAVTFEDHVIPEERRNGIASSTVKVIDTQTNDVLAEMRRYAWMPGVASAGDPSPWQAAQVCPRLGNGGHDSTRQFVDRVLVARGATLPPPLK